MTIVQYIFFARSGCTMNQTAITINLLFVVAVSLISVHPTIQEYNPKAGPRAGRHGGGLLHVPDQCRPSRWSRTTRTTSAATR